MTLPSCHFIGCGRLGQTIAKLLVDNQLVALETVYTTSLATAQKAIEFIGQGQRNDNLIDIEGDIICIATSDGQIAEVAQRLADQANLSPQTVVVHFSGSLSTSVLNPLKQKGCAIASIHPLRGFADPVISCQKFSGTFCTVEGDQLALDVMIPMFEKIGGQCLSVQSEHKALYHAASSFAGNFILALADIAMQMFIQSGLDKQHSYQVTHSLMQTVLDNFRQPDLTGVLTGPISRADIGTVKSHINAIQGTPYAEPYRVLAQAAMTLAELTEQQQANLIDSLSKLKETN